jgi:hypothetical protein
MTTHCNTKGDCSQIKWREELEFYRPGFDSWQQPRSVHNRVQTCSGAHKISYPIGEADHCLHPMPDLKMLGALPLIPIHNFQA